MKFNVWKLHDILLIAGAVSFFVYLFYTASQRQLVADDFMVVNKIYIPDFIEGEDPQMIYDRSIHRPFSGDWKVEVYQVGDNEHSCLGSGYARYLPSSSTDGFTLSYYVGRLCDYTPGVYLAHTKWITEDGIVIYNTSNVFRVFEFGELREGRTHDNR